jgi:hypothetical protein
MAKSLVDDALRDRVEPLLPVVQRRYRYPDRKRIPDRRALTGIPVRPQDRYSVGGSAR